MLQPIWVWTTPIALGIYKDYNRNMFTLPNWLEGFLRGVGLVLLVALLGYLGDRNHLSFIGNPVIVTLIVGLAASWEASIKASSGSGLFGATKTR